MPKPVEAPAPHLTPGIANLKDMTQPMGPLEEGDQALVDAMHRLPEGQRMVHDKLGGVTSVNKSKSLGYSEVKVAASSGGGAYESINVTVDTTPENSIGVHTFDRNGDGDSDTRISGNDIRFNHGNMHHERETAQAIKRETADRLNTLTQELGHGAVRATQR